MNIIIDIQQKMYAKHMKEKTEIEKDFLEITRIKERLKGTAVGLAAQELIQAISKLNISLSGVDTLRLLGKY